jgi:hypothetical protein
MRASNEVTTVVEDGLLQPRVTERRVCRLPLPPHPIAAEQARVFLRLVCAGWGLGGAIDDLLLVTAELVTNAMKVGDVVELSISRQDWSVLVEVWDTSEAVPDRQSRSVDRVDGRGLLLVEACSKEWGWRLEEHGGKTVWSILDIPDPVHAMPSADTQV